MAEDLFGPRPPRSIDPDVAAVVSSFGHELSSYEIVRVKAELLLEKLSAFDLSDVSPLDRMKALASIAGFPVQAGNSKAFEKSGKAAMFVPAANGSKSYIVFNPLLPSSRVIFSIGHEIAHSFFPNSKAGVRFRSAHTSTSKPGRELEMLCEFGGAQLAMPTKDVLESIRTHGFGLANVPTIANRFGTSFEATVYRVAQVVGFPAAALKLQYRFSKKDLASVHPKSGSLFPDPDREQISPKYRLQSFHKSESLQGWIPWNKSFSTDSCVYRVAQTGRIHTASERVPLSTAGARMLIEAISAPYQPGTDPDHPDVLALIRQDGVRQ